jgi:indolepyruvate ferredoxin oxidoreductase
MRLWASDRFREQLESEFEGDYRVLVHLSPQILLRRDPDTGRVRKLALGRRAIAVLSWLRHLKFLRHSFVDVFNRTAHRRREWALVGEYEKVVDELLRALSPSNLDLAVEIARIPEQIRGFDTVKDAQIEAAKAKEAELLVAFRQRSSD